MNNDTSTGSNDDDGSSSSKPATTKSSSSFKPFTSMFYKNPIIDSINEYRYSKRVERLKGCKVLEDTLQDCKNVSDGIQAHRLLRLEDTKDGIRVVRLMKWQESRISLVDGTTQIQSEIIDGRYNSNLCQREEHAIWLCRGLCLQCGPDILNLRECIDTNKSIILNQPTTYYKSQSKSTTTNNTNNNTSQRQNFNVDSGDINNTNNTSNSTDSLQSTTTTTTTTASDCDSRICIEYQQKIGQCVTDGIKFLNQYQKEKKEKELNSIEKEDKHN